MLDFYYISKRNDRDKANFSSKLKVNKQGFKEHKNDQIKKILKKKTREKLKSENKK